MLILRNIKLSVDTDFSNLQSAVEEKLNTKFQSVKLFRKSVDARHKDDIFFNCTVLVTAQNESALVKKLKKYGVEFYKEEKYIFPRATGIHKRPVVVGFGPAGMFAALSLASAGLKPIVLERGRDADSRIKDVNRFFGTNVLDETSNIQFGEGGAGTFSDGKLNTGIKDPKIRTVLETFVENGACDNILYDSKPHIGTDVLVGVVKSIRRKIIALGGDVLFEHKLVNINLKAGKVAGVTAETPNGQKEMDCDCVLLGIGHSARDTFLMLQAMNILMQPKPFAVGARIEHSQGFIDEVQYGKFAGHPNLGAADYKLAVHLGNGRGVYTFCMCPGGEVVNASSEKGRVAVNGMSFNARNGKNANSAVLCEVKVEDYFKTDVLDGMYFQREIEEKAFKFGKGLPIAQSVGEFLGLGTADTSIVPSVKTGVTYGNIADCLPQFVVDGLKEGLPLLDKRLIGFADKNAMLTAPETRSSSPVRIIRNELGVASVEGLYPMGEGAGYAGGITSAAVDGLNTAEKVIRTLSNR